jgi:hypothetical protein
MPAVPTDAQSAASTQDVAMPPVCPHALESRLIANKAVEQRQAQAQAMNAIKTNASRCIVELASIRMLQEGIRKKFKLLPSRLSSVGKTTKRSARAKTHSDKQALQKHSWINYRHNLAVPSLLPVARYGADG